MPENHECLRLLDERDDLAPFGNHAFVLLAIESRFSLSDVLNLAPTILTDGANDKKTDLLFVGREARTAVICQSYWAQSPKSNPPANKAADLHTAASWVLDPADPTALGAELAGAREELLDALSHSDIDDLELWYCHNLSPYQDAQAEAEQAANMAKTILSSKLGYSVNVRGVEVTPTRVDEWLRSSDGRVVIHDKLRVPAREWLSEQGDQWKAVYTSVSAAWLHGLYVRFSSERLFAGNIRGDMKPRRSANDINNGIQETATSKPGRLWAYNNGLTALVEKIEEEEKADNERQLVIRGISIVNGAQTTGSIGRLGSDLTDRPEARVLIRFVEASDPAVVREISTFNNTQNEILASDFRSSDAVQDRLVQEFKTLQTAIYWGPRRGGSQQGARRPAGLLDADLVAQALAAFHGAPDIAYHAKNEIWRDNTTYDRFFSDTTSAPHVVFCVGLIRAIRTYKMDLRVQSERSKLQEQIFQFLSSRGSDFLLMYAIANSIEEILDRVVADKWSLSFGDTVGLGTAADYWSPVVRSLASYVSQLSPAAQSGNLRDEERVRSAATEFQSRIAMGRQGVQALDDFVPLVAG